MFQACPRDSVLHTPSITYHGRLISTFKKAEWNFMDFVELFETWSLYIGIGGVFLFMLFIVWALARKSNAGKFGTFILFLVLGLCLMGFIIKIIIAEMLNV